MARVEFTSAVQGFRGKIDRMVYRQQNGATVVYAPHDRKPRRPTAAQKSQRSRFQAAQAYAAGVLAHPLRRAHYQKLGLERGQPPNALLISNFLTPPAIEHIDANGYAGRANQPIEIVATDAIEVTAVDVTIRDAAKAVIETGAARCEHGVWTYRTTVAAPRDTTCTIEISARNRAGASATDTLTRAV